MSADDEFEQTRKELTALKDARDYKSLLKQYCFAFGDKKDLIFTFLSEDLSIIEPFLGDPDSNYRKYAIEFFKDVGSQQGILCLFNRLLKEDRPDLLTAIKEAICQNEALEEIQDDLLKSVGDLAGKRFELLAEIISLSEDPSFLRCVISRIKKRCHLGFETCAKDVVPVDSFFVGHFFSREKIDDLRPVINSAIASVWQGCTPCYADDDGGTYLLCKICEKIQKTRFGIYDITIEPGREYSNPNVMLEIGMSMAFGKTTIIIMESEQKAPSDLQGRVLIYYESLKHLNEKLISLLPTEFARK